MDTILFFINTFNGARSLLDESGYMRCTPREINYENDHGFYITFSTFLYEMQMRTIVYMLCVTVEESVSTESTTTRVTARNDPLENSVVRTLKGQRVCFGDTFSRTVKAFRQNRN